MIIRVCSPEKVVQFQYLWTIGAQMTDMEEVLTRKCCYSCGQVHLCAAASAPLLLFTLGLKTISFKAMFRRLTRISWAEIIFGANVADCRLVPGFQLTVA
jgi:hypothetical protein